MDVQTSLRSTQLTVVEVTFDHPEQWDNLIIRAQDRDYGFKCVSVSPGLTGLSHAVNFAKYLTRMGKEPVNEKSHMNRAFHERRLIRASGREFPEGAQLCKDLAERFSTQLDQTVSEVVGFASLTDDFDEESIETSIFTDLMFMHAMLGHDITSDDLVTHFDQGWKGSAAHMHRVLTIDASTRVAQPTMFELVLEGLRSGVVGLGDDLSDDEVAGLSKMIQIDYAAERLDQHAQR